MKNCCRTAGLRQSANPVPIHLNIKQSRPHPPEGFIGCVPLESIFVPEARGKKFNRIIDDFLRPIRVRIAHAVLDSGELALSADEDMDIRQVYKWVSLTKSIARHMLKSDFPSEFLPYWAPAGLSTKQA